MAGRRKEQRDGLLEGYLDRISIAAFDSYRREITELAALRQGVYALYKGNRLYYVGLAIDLRRRLDCHLRDRHNKRWDRFSLYFVRKFDHLKELESLILHIAEPPGNRVGGHLNHSPNLIGKLKRAMEIKDSKRREQILYE